MKNLYPHIPILALTATADLDTRTDIIKRLQINSNIYISSFLRDNLRYQVLNKYQPIKQIQRFIEQHKNESGIIYCATRKGVDKIHKQLTRAWYDALPYHARFKF